MDYETIIRAYVEERLLEGERLAPAQSLWDGGAVDSLGIIRLVRFLETTFDIRVPHADVTPKTFATVETIAAYVSKRRKTKK